MVERKTFCDHCGKEITDANDLFHISADIIGYVDLCCICNEMINNIINKNNKEIVLFCTAAKNGGNKSK